MLKPLAPTLMKFNLSKTKLGGTITDDVTAFMKLTELFLCDMGINGTFVVWTPVRV